MREPNQPGGSWLGERLAVAAISAVLAALTLIVTPFLLAFAGAGLGALVALEAGGVWYGLMLSKAGLAVIGLAAASGFVAGGERMANVFGFVWGTHDVWSRIGQRISNWSERHGEHIVPFWLTLLLLVSLVIVGWLQVS